jgi:hypothetical protein
MKKYIWMIALVAFMGLFFSVDANAQGYRHHRHSYHRHWHHHGYYGHNRHYRHYHRGPRGGVDVRVAVPRPPRIIVRP